MADENNNDLDGTSTAHETVAGRVPSFTDTSVTLSDLEINTDHTIGLRSLIDIEKANSCCEVKEIDKEIEWAQSDGNIGRALKNSLS